MDAGAFKVTLEGLPFLTNADRLVYRERAAQGENMSTLLRYAYRASQYKRRLEIGKRRRNFAATLSDMNLGGRNKQSLLRLINDKTDLRRLRARAAKLVEIRKKQAKARPQQALSRFLTGLKINQADKNAFIKRLGEGESVSVIRKDALALQKRVAAKGVSKERQFLKDALVRLGLTQVQQDQIMSKFRPGKAAIQGLIQEGRRLKQLGTQQNIASKRVNLTKLAQSLNVGKQFESQISAAQTNEEIEVLRKSIENAGETRRTTTVAEQKERLVSVARELGIYTTFAGSIAGAKTKEDVDVVRVNLVESGKRKLSELAAEKNVETKIPTVISLDRLVTLKKNMERTASEQVAEKRRKNFEKLTQEKQRFVNFVQKSELPQNKKQVFINRMRLNKVDIPKLRENVKTNVENMKKTARQKDLNELRAYVKNLNVDKNKFIKNFETTNISLTNAKNKVNEALQKKAQVQSEKDELLERAKTISYNLNVSNLKTARENLEKAYQKKLSEEKKKLSNLALSGNVDLLDDIAAIDTIEAIVPMREVIQYQIGIMTNNPQNIKNARRAMKNSEYAQVRLMKNAFKRQRNTNRQALKLFLNGYKTLTANDKKQFLQNFNAGVNIPVIQVSANAYAQQKRGMKTQNKVDKLAFHLTRIGLTPVEQQPFIQRLVMNDEPMNTIKKDADRFFIEKFTALRESNRGKLIEGLKKFNLDRTNFNHIMNKFNKTYIPPQKLLNEAKTIEGFRKRERWVESNAEFIDYMDTLTGLTHEDRQRIKMALDGYFIDFAPLKKSATNAAIKTVNAPRAKNRKALVNHLNKAGLKNRVKIMFLRNFDSNVANLNTIKAQITNFKNSRNQEAFEEKQEKFASYLNRFKFLKNEDKMMLLDTYAIKGEATRNEAKNLNAVRKNQGAFNLKTYLVNNLGLNEKNNRVKRSMNKYTMFPQNINTIMTKAEQNKLISNERTRLLERVKNLPNSTKLENRIKGLRDLNGVAPLDQDITNAYAAVLRKDISNMALQSGIKFEMDLSKIVTPQDANQARMRLLGALKNKKGVEYTKLRESIKNMFPQNQNSLLQKFASQNVSLKNVLKNASELRKKRTEEQQADERRMLYEFINTELDLNVNDRKSILKNFDKTKNLSTMQVKATNLKKKRIAEKIAENRLKVEKLIDPLNLSNADKKTILNSFNTNPGNVLAFETQAKALKKMRVGEKRSNERQQLLGHLRNLKLSETNTKKIMNVFDKNPEQKLNASKLNASNLRVQRNRERLVGVMKDLVISNENKKTILKSFRTNPASLNALILRARQINTKARGQLNLQKRLRNYVVSLRLGENGTKILKKIDKTLTPASAKTIKAEADRAKAESNAILIRKKKDEIKQYMNTSNLSENVKSSFLKGVKLNTNVNVLKRKIQTTIQNLKKQTSRRGKLRTELKVYLNTLDLTNDVKQRLIGSVGDATRSINPLKRRASQMVKEAQKMRIRTSMRQQRARRTTARAEAENVRWKSRMVQIGATRKREVEEKLKEKKRQEEKPVLEKHLFGLTHLSKREINAYMKSFMNGKTDLTKTITLSSAKDKQNEKSRNFLLKFVSKLPIKPVNKEAYLTSLKVPRADIAVIRTKLRNYVIKQPMPTKEKKRLVDQLLGLK
jgi:hypothetical protein